MVETNSADFKRNAAKANDVSLAKLDSARRSELDYFPQKVVDLVDVRFLVGVAGVVNVIVVVVVHYVQQFALLSCLGILKLRRSLANNIPWPLFLYNIYEKVTNARIEQNKLKDCSYRIRRDFESRVAHGSLR